MECWNEICDKWDDTSTEMMASQQAYLSMVRNDRLVHSSGSTSGQSSGSAPMVYMDKGLKVGERILMGTKCEMANSLD